MSSDSGGSSSKKYVLPTGRRLSLSRVCCLLLHRSSAGRRRRLFVGVVPESFVVVIDAFCDLVFRVGHVSVNVMLLEPFISFENGSA